MNRNEILHVLYEYNILPIGVLREIDSSIGADYRLNVIIDNKWVLRISDDKMDEARLQSIDRLCERYRSIGVLTPKLFSNKNGMYLTRCGEYHCYLSEYLDYQTLDRCDTNYIEISNEVLMSIGTLSSRFSGIDLTPTNSMWSLIDLAPLDIDIDEKQENLNMLVNKLIEIHEEELALKLVKLNEINRDEIKKVYKTLPRCVIQGDLNDSNILVERGRFIGLIDFNMSGTEVNINHFCCEANVGIDEQSFERNSAGKIYAEMVNSSEKNLRTILSQYKLNEAEETSIPYYRKIVLLSQYSNVKSYIHYLSFDKNKMCEILRAMIDSE
jgi:Ser/Thr protein kinase RdoA (MazF antagonist)